LANSFVNKKVDLTTTSETTLYTVPTATTAIVKSILVSEDSGNADTITVTITDTSSNVFSLFKTKQLIDYMWSFRPYNLSQERLQHSLDLLVKNE